MRWATAVVWLGAFFVNLLPAVTSKVLYFRRRKVIPPQFPNGYHEYHDEKLFVAHGETLAQRHLLGLPIGGATSDSQASDAKHVEGAVVEFANAGAGMSAAAQSDTSDIFYEKLIIFKKTHVRSEDSLETNAAREGQRHEEVDNQRVTDGRLSRATS
ncbi:hypothetical protein ACHHYP_20081 [Achlya hypogyna]|uniref:Uncharacterized protein n=1 Tax=Achlya hypogyna TaxID=1202772 RepID=A0A1V9Z7U9_ACHHY|nr:hypothetical protein ACHHYP_20081 [Achlya hypogyna]